MSFFLRNSVCQNCQSKVNSVSLYNWQCADNFIFIHIFIFTARRYALRGLSYRNSVRPPVRHTRGLCPHGLTHDHDFFTK